jgi:C-terminal processing protease CtpA/Prc
MVTSWLKQHTNAVFIGQQSAGGYNGNNGGSFPSITLPNTKCQIVLPAYRLLLDGKSAQDYGIVPDLIVEPIIREDSVLTKTIELIQSERK